MFGTGKLKAAPAYGADGTTPAQFRNSASSDGKSKARGNTIAAIFVRHGETAANDTNKALVRGTLDNADTQLNARGRKEAAQAGRSIARHGGVSAVFHAPLGRGKDTAKAIASATGAKAVEKPGLMPWDKGDAQGKPIKTEDPKLRDFAINKRDTAVPGGEAYGKFATRSDTTARSVVKAGKRSLARTGKPVAAVTHSVDDRRLPHAIEGKPEPEPLNGGLEPGEMMGVTVSNKLVKLKPGMWGTR